MLYDMIIDVYIYVEKSVRCNTAFKVSETAIPLSMEKKAFTQHMPLKLPALIIFEWIVFTAGYFCSKRKIIKGSLCKINWFIVFGLHVTLCLEWYFLKVFSYLLSLSIYLQKKTTYEYVVVYGKNICINHTREHSFYFFSLVTFAMLLGECLRYLSMSIFYQPHGILYLKWKKNCFRISITLL